VLFAVTLLTSIEKADNKPMYHSDTLLPSDKARQTGTNDNKICTCGMNNTLSNDV